MENKTPKSKIKRIISTILVFLFLFLLIYSPFAAFSIKDRLLNIKHKKEYVKLKVKVDSVIPNVGNHSGGDSNLYGFYLYYNNPKDSVQIYNPEGNIFISKQNKEHYYHFFKIDNATPFYLPKNDSIWVWHHKKLPDEYATENQLHFETSGFLLQIFLNTVILIIVICGVIWQIKQWIKLKQKK